MMNVFTLFYFIIIIKASNIHTHIYEDHRLTTTKTQIHL